MIRVIVQQEHWSRHISEGATLITSMIMFHLRRKAGTCPRPNCAGSGTAEPCERAKLLTRYAFFLSTQHLLALTRYSGTCRLNFFPALDELEGVFGYILVYADDVIIARRQAMEDLQLYGSRPEPLNVIDLDQSSRLASKSLYPSQRATGYQIG